MKKTDWQSTYLTLSHLFFCFGFAAISFIKETHNYLSQQTIFIHVKVKFTNQIFHFHDFRVRWHNLAWLSYTLLDFCSFICILLRVTECKCEKHEIALQNATINRKQSLEQNFL